MTDKLKKMIEYNTAPKCPFCGGTMLPLNYLADVQGYRCSHVWLYDDIQGDLKACDNCGIVKFYPNTKE